MKASVYIAITLLFSAQVYADNSYSGVLEIGYEHAELEQNDYRDLGSSNYTFFIGQQFTKRDFENWGWRFLSIQVDLSNEHLRDTKAVCCINGNRENLIGELNIQRLYLDYYLSPLININNFRLEFIPSFGIGYTNLYLKDTKANEEHDVKAYTIGGALRLKFTLYDHFFIEMPNIDLGVIVKKNTDINATVGEATIDRPEYFTFFLLTTIGYRMTF